ncbi:MAG: AI-2E family transporter [bacterium]|nr:AI-2E family transporter [bacterium]
MPHSRTIQLVFFFSIFGLTLLLGFFIFKPYLNILVLAGMFAIIFNPVYQKLLKKLGGKREGIAAMLTVILVAVILGTPLGLIGARVVNEAGSLYGRFGDAAGTEQPVFGAMEASENPLIRNAQEKFNGFLTKVSNDLDTYVQKIGTWIVEHAGPFFQGIAQFALAIFLWLLSVYYFLKEGSRIKAILVKFSPLSDRYDLEIVNRIVTSVKSVIGGSLIVAVLQGVLAGIGFAIFGVPMPAIWGLVAVFAALVPTIGTALVTLPTVAFLMLTGHMVPALGLLLWGILIVGAIDNIVRPKLLERGVKVHPLTILLSVLGGLAFFGPVGFLTGPVIVSLLSEFLNIYQHLVLQKEQ